MPKDNINKFTFDGAKILENEIATQIFSSFFEPNNQIDNQIENEHCIVTEKDKQKECTFYLATTDEKKQNFKVFSFTNNSNDNVFNDLPKIKLCLSDKSKYEIKLKNNEDDEYQLQIGPYPLNYAHSKISAYLSLKINEVDIQKAIKDKMWEIDYNRILDRSFIYFIEYGTTEEFELIVSNKDSFSELEKHLISNQKILKNNQDIEEEIKNGKSDKSYQLIKRYKDIDKNSLKIYEFKKCYKKYFEEEIIKINVFKEIFFGQNERKCAYCGVPEDKLDHLHTVRAGRGNRLEYDRISSRDGVDKKEYTKANIVLSCYWCNNAKTDTFSAKEFKEIARGINRVWNQKLKKANSNETICFPENSEIWDKE
jgi:5-methylcytosine-specific restriction endonuclease McrA